MTNIVSLMALYFRTADWQTRTSLYVDRRLAAAAMCRADDMSKNHYFSHQNLDDVWPNQIVREYGYFLPDWYKDDSNQVESIASGYTHAPGALDALALSPLHHDHVRGLGFWDNHTHYGCGYSDVGGCRVYVLLTAPKENDPLRIEPTIFIPFLSKGLFHEPSLPVS